MYLMFSPAIIAVLLIAVISLRDQLVSHKEAAHNPSDKNRIALCHSSMMEKFNRFWFRQEAK